MGMHEAMGASEDVTSSDNPHLCTKLEMGPMSAVVTFSPCKQFKKVRFLKGFWLGSITCTTQSLVFIIT